MTKKHTGRIIRYYDDSMYHERLSEYFGGSDHFNYGYWEADIPDQKTACENLLERLLALLPSRSGKILDVACGKGETARYLTNYYNPGDITGINISEKQLQTCRAKVPGAAFLQMDGAKLEFPDNSFEAVVCVEAVFHFHTRETFLEEAYRVVRPRGALVLTDILLTDWGREHRLWWIDPENAGINCLQDYQDLYRRAGFENIRVIDATRECWQGYYTNVARYCCEKLDRRELESNVFNGIAVNIFRRLPATQAYLLVAAQKP